MSRCNSLLVLRRRSARRRGNLNTVAVAGLIAAIVVISIVVIVFNARHLPEGGGGVGGGGAGGEGTAGGGGAGGASGSDAKRVVKQVSAGEFAKLVALRSQAIGLLESEQLVEAEAVWGELEKLLPDEPLILQNRAVGGVLRTKKVATTEAHEAALAAVRRLQKAAPKSPIGRWLEGTLLINSKDRQPTPELQDAMLADAVAAFARAAELDPRDEASRYAIFDQTKFATDERLVERGQEALREARDGNAKNSVLALDWLEVAAKKQDPKFGDLLDQLQKLVEPFRPGIERRTSQDLRKFIDQAKQNAEAGKWPQAGLMVNRIGNLVRSEDFNQADRRRLQPNPLAFVQHEFETVKGPADMPPDAPPAIEVKLVAVPGLDPLAAITDATELRWSDLNLDGRPDLIVLRPEKLVSFIQSADGAFAAGPELAVRAGLTRFLLADLDRDSKLPTQGAPGRPSVDPRAAVAAKPDGAKPDGAAPVKKELRDMTPEERAKELAAFYQSAPDLILYGPSGVSVVKNEVDTATRQRSWQIVAQPTGLDELKTCAAATLVDLDHDGDLDLAACAADELGIWINRGAMVFDLVPSAGAATKGNAITALAAVDWDRDIDSDILAVADNGRQLFILENQRHLEFSWHAIEAGPAARGGEPPLLNAGAGVEAFAIIESDGNASWDVAVVGASGARLVLTDTPAPGSTQLRKVANYDDIKSGASGGRLVLADLDNDGHDDFLIAADGRLAVHRGASGGMTSEPWKLGDGPISGVADVDAVDFDLDGDLDVVVCGAEGVRVHRNEGGTKNHWLDIWITGLDEALSGRVNHFAVGAFVEVKSGTSYQAKLVTRPFTHFGLGARTDVDVARVMFPNGVPQSVVKPRRDELLLEAQRLLGSCPYLYTWTGERFEFFTDLLWAAPIGLQVADGVIMRDRPWEYLKIDGERLVTRDGEYQIQITEELWEAGYFDQVELIAIDHPADVEVFSNEKVGPPTIAQRMIHTARRKQTPVYVRNHRGRDLSAETARRDGVFAQPFDRTVMQGVAEPHHMEIDLGPAALARSATGSTSATDSTPAAASAPAATSDSAASSPAPAAQAKPRIKLFMTGWIYPTDTSLNIGISQNPQGAGPKPPRILVPSEGGEWREAVPFMGFPGGKTKTIVVDLTGVLAPGDSRLRIESSAELRWDEIFFTVDEGEGEKEVRETTLAIRRADLHYRGCSRPIPRVTGGPETYDYAVCDVEPQWPPMRGRFTRFGDVKELLTDWDDRMVVLGAGDEMTVVFDAGPPVPPGWKRDFLLHNVGWDKDCAINTIYGQTVEPMPFKSMPSYPYVESDYDAKPELSEYLRTYQTREQSAAGFWRRLKGAK